MQQAKREASAPSSLLPAAAALKRVKAELETMQATIEELRKKNEAALRAKALTAAERDRLGVRVASLEARLSQGGRESS
ncbi:hypothetical protein Efla_001989 [Eimeria flavescens]